MTMKNNNIHYKQRNLIEKYIELYTTQIKIAIKSGIEYKSNFWSVILLDTALFFVVFLFFSVFFGFVNEIINWETKDYILMYFLLSIAAKILWMFFLRNFNSHLIKGDMNNALSRPLSPYYFMNVKYINGANVLLLILLIIVTIGVVIFTNYTNYLLSISIFFFGVLYFHIFYNMLSSFAFHFKENDFLIDILNRKLNYAIEEYSPKMFLSSPIELIAFLMPGALYGFFTLEALKGRTNLFWEFLPYLLISFVIMIILLSTLWHLGLKKYEAYG